jgi:ribosome production factor 1
MFSPILADIDRQIDSPLHRLRQVVTLHNQRDFLFFRRHRYAFRSTEKAALQEIGPRFTLKLRWLKKGLPSVGGAFGFGEHPPTLEVDVGNEDHKGEDIDGEKGDMQDGEERAAAARDEVTAVPNQNMNPPKGGLDEYEWIWKVRHTVRVGFHTTHLYW